MHPRPIGLPILTRLTHSGFLPSLLFLLPLAVGYRLTLDPFNVPKVALLLAGCAALTPTLQRRLNGASAALRDYALPAACVALPLTISWLASPYHGWGLMGQYGSFQGVIPTLALLGLGAFVAMHASTEQRSLVTALATSGALAGAYAVLQVVGLDPLEWAFHGKTLEGSSTLGNPNHAGSFLALVLPLSLGVLRRASPLSILRTGLIVGGLLATRSEGALGAAAAGVVLYGGLALRERRRWASSLATAIVGVIAVVLVGLVSQAMVNDDFGAANPNLRDRGWFWVAAGGVFLDHPVIGGGPNAFAIEGVRHRVVDESVSSGYASAIEPHSLPLTVAASTGLVGLAGWLMVLVWVLRRWPEQGADGVAVAWACSLGTYLVLSLVAADQLTLRVVAFAALGGLAAYGAARRDPRGEGAVEVPPRINGLLALGAGSLAIAAVWWALLILVADTRALSGTRAARDGDHPRALELLGSATDTRHDFEYDYHLASTLSRAVATEDLEGEADLIRSAWAFVKDFPDPLMMGAYARSLSASEPTEVETQEEALRLFRRAIDLDPANPLARADAALVLVVLGRTNEAIDVLDSIYFLKPPWSRYWGAQAIVSVSAEQRRVARAQIGLALEIDPNEPLALEAQRLLDVSSKR